ncbi:MAG: protein-(glutamine-N5) methyltransferase, release factor-specific [Clostridiales bacterium GWE2_32_10]|nr:MAG: protein-(glutamine-N5) methyltransferase, release factor-specific [Clostridiales bacterium GWE2_32_10]HBY20314.1 peptide chain release factor N(5)-glutamine methyltransferase [Clostridiales bacterium]
MNEFMQILKKGKEKLKQSDITTFSLDAELIMGYVTGESRERMLAGLVNEISDDNADRFLDLIDRRASKYPVQYITNYQEFMSLPFYVDERVLIPRPDTEILIENVIKCCKNKKNIVLLDICTGSGCIAISIAKYMEDISIIAVDISNDSLMVATYNADINNVLDKITFIQSDLFESLAKDYMNVFDIIVSNPPYIERGEIPKLSREVKDFEPRLALDGGNSGLDFYRKITKESGMYLKNNGKIFYEIGYNQGNAVKNILVENGFRDIEITKDLAGLDRCVVGELE